MRGLIILFGALCALAIGVEGRPQIQLHGAFQHFGGEVVPISKNLTKEEAEDRGLTFHSDKDTEELGDKTPEEAPKPEPDSSSGNVLGDNKPAPLLGGFPPVPPAPPAPLVGAQQPNIPQLPAPPAPGFNFGTADESADDSEDESADESTPVFPPGLIGYHMNADGNLVPDVETDSAVGGDNNSNLPFSLPDGLPDNIPPPPPGLFSGESNFGALFNNANTESSDTPAAPPTGLFPGLPGGLPGVGNTNTESSDTPAAPPLPGFSFSSFPGVGKKK